MSDDAVLYEKEGPVARVILNRPERRNALTDPMFTQIVECYRRAERDDDVKVIVLMGKGDTFCVGFDLRDPDLFYEGADVGENNVRDGIYALRFRTEVMRDMMFVLKPTIARVHRHCIGAGLFLTLVADFAIASDNTVLHDRMSEARIAYGGRGELTEVQHTRWGQQLMDVLLPF